MHARRSVALLTTALAPIALFFAGCETWSQDRVLGIDATGNVSGVVRLDATGNGNVDASDPGVAGVRVHLRLAGTEHRVTSGPSDSDGVLSLPDLPVGTYVLEIDDATVGDSVEVVDVSGGDLVVGAGQTLEVSILLGYPHMTIAEARNAPFGQRVFVEGVILNARTNFGDNTIHLQDSTMAVRMTRPGAVNVVPGDSVRVLGTRLSLDGQAILDQLTIVQLGPGAVPVPLITNAHVAAEADEGRLDAALVRVMEAVIIERATTPAGFRLTVFDGVGIVSVRLDALAAFPIADYQEGAVIDVRGLLVPGEVVGEWEVRPRGVADVILVSPA